jgi:aminoglycoside 3-N-acetyltransferase
MADTHPVGKSDIVAGLAALGVRRGDHLLVHSSLSSFGRVEGGADAVIDALLEAVGTEGTIVVPTFGSRDAVFDPARSETSLGAIPTALWKRPGSLRSSHPLASAAAVGARAAWLLQGHVEAETAHGEGTPYHRLTEIDGKILLLGVDQDRSTFLHTAEEVARLAYLRPHTGTYRDRSGRPITRAWSFFPGPHRAFIGIQEWLERRELTRKAAIGSCVAQLLQARPLLEALLERLREDPALFISDNPNLPDGVWQRAALLRVELDRESFTLAADSADAACGIDELLHCLARHGIRHVVLSSIGGTPWPAIEDAWRAWLLQGLTLAGIRVAALRLGRLEPERAILLAREAGTETVIVPSTAPADAVVDAAGRGLRVLLGNTGISGAEVVRILRAPDLASRSVGLAFDPLGFLAAGENPFLGTYSKTRVRLHVGLLEAADGLPSGERTPLGRGLGEIAEILSMLRTSRYRGLVVLRGASGARLDEEALRFMSLLRTLGRPV